MVVVGGGIAGLSAAYALARGTGCAVVVVEQETQLAQHTTGRSAAMFLEHYGGPVNQRLTAASRPFLEAPPDGLCDHPVLTLRAFLTFARPGEEELLAEEVAAVGLLAEVEPLDAPATRALAPYLRRDAVAGGMLEPGAQDIDVMGLDQGYVRGARAAGVLARRPGCEDRPAAQTRWSVTTEAGGIETDVVVDAAGAGVTRSRRWPGSFRSGCGPSDARPSPCVCRRSARRSDGQHGRAGVLREAGVGRAHAVLTGRRDGVGSLRCRPEEIDVAAVLDAMDTTTTLGARHVTRAWAGLRKFAPDRDR